MRTSVVGLTVLFLIFCALHSYGQFFQKPSQDPPWGNIYLYPVYKPNPKIVLKPDDMLAIRLDQPTLGPSNPCGMDHDGEPPVDDDLWFMIGGTNYRSKICSYKDQNDVPGHVLYAKWKVLPGSGNFHGEIKVNNYDNGGRGHAYYHVYVQPHICFFSPHAPNKTYCNNGNPGDPVGFEVRFCAMEHPHLYATSMVVIKYTKPKP